NLRLSSDLKSNEPTLQVVYDVLKLTPFYKAFQITGDVPEIYMQEFWATAIVHHHSIRFKMNNKKHIVNLEYFREMLQICPKLPDQQFKEPPFEKEILTFLRDLGHSREKGDEPPKTKESVKKKQAVFDKTKTPPTAKGKRLKTLAKVALTEAEQIKLATKRSLIQTHSSYASGLGADEGTGGKPGVPNVPTYESDDEQISWKSNDEEDDDEVVMSDDADENDDQNDDNADNENKEEEWSDDEAYDDKNQGANVEGEEQDEEEINEEDEANELYRDVNVNNRVLLYVSVTTIAEPHLLSATTLPPPPIPLITHPQQTPFPTPATVPSPSLQDLPNFGSLFRFDHRIKTLEPDFSEFKQTNQFATAVSLIPGIVDAYLANKMHEAVKIVVQL
ncbi:hypothetical protein Tco_1086013, partial [Tanacetum coccineum]